MFVCFTATPESVHLGHQNVGDNRNTVRFVLATNPCAQHHRLVLSPKSDHTERLHDVCGVLIRMPLAINGTQLSQSLYLWLYERKLQGIADRKCF